MQAVIKTGGKQYRVQPGDELDVEKLGEYESGDDIVFDEVLSVGEGENIEVGRPLLEDASVEAKVLTHGREKKKMVFKKKAKEGYKKKKGHRQPFTKIRITNVES
jgi:large subunit ribosomal protein L21